MEVWFSEIKYLSPKMEVFLKIEDRIFKVEVDSPMWMSGSPKSNQVSISEKWRFVLRSLHWIKLAVPANRPDPHRFFLKAPHGNHLKCSDSLIAQI